MPRRHAAGLLSMIAAVLFILLAGRGLAWAQGDATTIFAVITKVAKDRKQVTAQVVGSAGVSETNLIPSDAVLDGPVWRKLEICHSLRAEAWKTPEGYRLANVKVVDAGMLPMPLQGIAGDCLLKKALEFNPQID